MLPHRTQCPNRERASVHSGLPPGSWGDPPRRGLSQEPLPETVGSRAARRAAACRGRRGCPAGGIRGAPRVLSLVLGGDDPASMHRGVGVKSVGDDLMSLLAVQSSRIPQRGRRLRSPAQAPARTARRVRQDGRTGFDMHSVAHASRRSRRLRIANKLVDLCRTAKVGEKGVRQDAGPARRQTPPPPPPRRPTTPSVACYFEAALLINRF